MWLNRVRRSPKQGKHLKIVKAHVSIREIATKSVKSPGKFQKAVCRNKLQNCLLVSQTSNMRRVQQMHSKIYMTKNKLVTGRIGSVQRREVEITKVGAVAQKGRQ